MRKPGSHVAEQGVQDDQEVQEEKFSFVKKDIMRALIINEGWISFTKHVVSERAVVPRLADSVLNG